VVKLYNDGMVQVVMFAYLVYWWVSCFLLSSYVRQGGRYAIRVVCLSLCLCAGLLQK